MRGSGVKYTGLAFSGSEVNSATESESEPESESESESELVLVPPLESGTEFGLESVDLTSSFCCDWE